LLGVLLQNKNEKEKHDVTIMGTRCKIKASGGLSLIALSIFWKANNNGRQCGVKSLGTADDYFQGSPLLYTLIPSTSLSH